VNLRLEDIGLLFKMVVLLLKPELSILVVGLREDALLLGRVSSTSDRSFARRTRSVLLLLVVFRS